MLYSLALSSSLLEQCSEVNKIIRTISYVLLSNLFLTVRMSSENGLRKMMLKCSHKHKVYVAEALRFAEKKFQGCRKSARRDKMN